MRKNWFHRFLLVLVLIPFGIIVLVVSSILFFPPLIFNSWTGPLYLSSLKFAGIQTSYKNLQFSISNNSLEDKNLKLQAHDLCLIFTDQSLSTCFRDMDVELDFKLARPILRIFKIDHILIVGDNFTYHQVPAAPTTDGGGLSLSDFLPESLDQLKIGFLSLDVHNVQILEAAAKLRGDLNFNLLKAEIDLPKSADMLTLKRRGGFSFDVHEANWDLEIKSRLNFETQGFGRRRPLDVMGSLDVSTSQTAPAQVQLEGHFFRPDDSFAAHVKVPKTCFEHASIGIHGCIKDLDLGTAGTFNSDGFKIKEFAPVQLHSDSLLVTLPESDSKADPKDPPTSLTSEVLQKISQQIFQLHLHDVDVDVKHLAIGQKDGVNPPTTVSARIFERKAALYLNSFVNLAAQRSTASTQLQVVTKETGVESRGVAKFRTPTMEVTVPLSLDVKENVARFDLSPEVIIFSTSRALAKKSNTPQTEALKVSSDIRGTWAGDKWDISFPKLLATLPKQAELSREFPGQCALHFVAGKNLDFDCSLKTTPLAQNISEVLSAIPVHVELKVKSEEAAKSSDKQLKSAEASWSGYAAIRSGVFKSDLIDGHVRARVDADHLNLDQANLEKLKIDTDIFLHLPHFQKWVMKSRNSFFAIPAPLNALDGEVSFESRVAVKDQSPKIPIRITTKLAGDQQTFNLEGKLLFLLNEVAGTIHPSLTGKITLDDVLLALPKIQIQAPPPLLPDSRIMTTAQMQKADASQERSPTKIVIPIKNDATGKSPSIAVEPAGGFDYVIDIVTPADHPLRLSSNLALKPIPIAIDLQISAVSGVRGTLEILEFPAQLFRRNAEVKFLKLHLKSNRTDENPITGRMEVKVNDYLVFVDLAGTMKTPLITLKSDPQLADNQIVPLLIFGKAVDQLDPDQAQSANNANSAIADRALGLFSLFYLASTPVESIGYNSQQKAFTAKVRLQEGLSLDVGADQSDLKQIGLNKRLSGSWMIRTYVTNPTDPTDQSVTAMLEKIFRY